MKKSLLLTMPVSLLIASADAQPSPAYRITNTFHIQSAGGYDYTTVDSASNRLYLSHGTQVNVIDKVTGDSIGVIRTDKDVHGIGTLTIIKEQSPTEFTVAENLKTKEGARTNAVDQLSHAVYLPTGEFLPKQPGQFRPQLKPGTFQVLVVKA